MGGLSHQTSWKPCPLLWPDASCSLPSAAPVVLAGGGLGQTWPSGVRGKGRGNLTTGGRCSLSPQLVTIPRGRPGNPRQWPVAFVPAGRGNSANEKVCGSQGWRSSFKPDIPGPAGLWHFPEKVPREGKENTSQTHPPTHPPCLFRFLIPSGAWAGPELQPLPRGGGGGGAHSCPPTEGPWEGGGSVGETLGGRRGSEGCGVPLAGREVSSHSSARNPQLFQVLSWGQRAGQLASSRPSLLTPNQQTLLRLGLGWDSPPLALQQPLCPRPHSGTDTQAAGSSGKRPWRTIWAAMQVRPGPAPRAKVAVPRRRRAWRGG